MREESRQKNTSMQQRMNIRRPVTEKKGDGQAKPSGQKLNYQLPRSFFDSVDEARLDAGYDILPRFHHVPTSATATPSSKQSRKQHERPRQAARPVRKPHEEVAPSKKARTSRTHHDAHSKPPTNSAVMAVLSNLISKLTKPPPSRPSDRSGR